MSTHEQNRQPMQCSAVLLLLVPRANTAALWRAHYIVLHCGVYTI